MKSLLLLKIIASLVFASHSTQTAKYDSSFRYVSSSIANRTSDNVRYVSSSIGRRIKDNTRYVSSSIGARVMDNRRYVSSSIGQRVIDSNRIIASNRKVYNRNYIYIPFRFPMIEHIFYENPNQYVLIPVQQINVVENEYVSDIVNNSPVYANDTRFVSSSVGQRNLDGIQFLKSIFKSGNLYHINPLFYIFHAYVGDQAVLKYQLKNDVSAVPPSYNMGLRYDLQTNLLLPSSLNDRLTNYSPVMAREAFQVGFGQLCYIHDQLIKPINALMSNEVSTTEPMAFKRLRQSLPPLVFLSLFPGYAPNSSVAFLKHAFADVVDCVPTTNCKPMPIAAPFNSTDNGRRQLEAFRNDLDISRPVLYVENLYYKFMNTLNRYKYCTPYA